VIYVISIALKLILLERNEKEVV